MFNTLKRELRIVEVLEYMTDIPYKEAGDNTWIPDGDECPSCGHKNCFRVKDAGVNEESYARCFSENVTWDVIAIVAKLKGIPNLEAAKLLAKHYEIKLPNDYSPMQEVFNLAADYYHTTLKNAGPCAELNGLTPIEYQRSIRRHEDVTFEHFQIGWSDGGLVEYLKSVGVTDQIIKESGLAGRRGHDFLPSKVFIYPHFVRGRVSHFTFKDVLKQKEFQVPNKYKLNGHQWYNSDSLNKSGPVAVVEGENDCLSLFEEEWPGGIICCNGSISGAQLEWMTTNLKGRDVVTFFDIDPAGDIYREKVGKLRKHFGSIRQVRVTGQVKDIDEFLKNGGDLTGLMDNSPDEEPIGHGEAEVEVQDGGEELSVIAKHGEYFRIIRKDGEEFLKRISNFKVELLNIFTDGGKTTREVVFATSDGRRSRRVLVPSDEKVNLQKFKVLLADALDASFYGNQSDLEEMWDLVMKDKKARRVNLFRKVGRVDDVGLDNSELHGWLFKDCFVSDNGGEVFDPDENGVIWVKGYSEGIKPLSIYAGDAAYLNQLEVPWIKSKSTEKERKELLATLIKAVTINLGGELGEVLTILGWCWATLYSNMIQSNTVKFFPMLQFWGQAGKGKTYFIRLFLDIFNMDGCGYTGISSLNSGVAYSRKLAYYSGLPMCIDEIRNDDVAAKWSNHFREWYNRQGRTVGDKDGKITGTPILSTIMFGGEDKFMDPATQQRCIPIRIRKNNRETVDSFRTLQSTRTRVHDIGYQWLLDFHKISQEEILADFNLFETFLKKSGVDERQAQNWAVIGIFANRICREYCEGYNYMEYMVKASSEVIDEQKDENTLARFWEAIEGLQALERPPITSDHLRRVNNELYIWFTSVYHAFEKDTTYTDRQKFSKSAILAAIREEPYFISEGRKEIGIKGRQRRCIVLDIDSAPDSIKNIAGFLNA